MDGVKADMVFTDPPYGVDYKGINNDSRDELSDLLNGAFATAMANTKQGGSVYCFHSDKCADIFQNCFRKYCHFSSMIIWKKSSLVLSQTDYQSIHEPCLYGWFDNGTHNFYGDRKQTSVWEFDRENIDGHTTPKPIGFIAKALKNSSKEGEAVLDVFGGSGSTLIACEQLNRKCYMAELDPKYCDVIRKRWTKWAQENGRKVGSGGLE
jgi:DNA modification methylase